MKWTSLEKHQKNTDLVLQFFSVQLESSKSFPMFQQGDQGNTFFSMYDSAVRNEMTGLTQ